MAVALPASTPADVDLAELGELLAAEAGNHERPCASIYKTGPCGEVAEYAIALWCPSCGVRSTRICGFSCLQIIDAIVFADEDIPVHCAHQGERATVLGQPSPLLAR